MTHDLDTLQNSISHQFKDVALLETALTHSSFANENGEDTEDNERLEFLGDAVLELSSSEVLFAKFPQAPEGQLTRLRAQLVSEPALAEVARELHINELLMLGKGEERQGGRERNSLLSDAFEAILGAVFLDGGYSAAQHVIGTVFESRWPEHCDVTRVKDSKSKLQELTQKLFRERPVYTLKSSAGPEHAKIFSVEVSLPDGTALVAEGSSVKKAEQNSALNALNYLKEKKKK
ncbi:ribonuclease III [Desulfobaculum bizertense]|uniref:Ribonuclease 3 n=1 Tax=Desulfobaculum bizertense DSM 18034 TaxID=1121442 RepID=A0A1T4VYB2_9BACT|nr:ribonuclease III [Desulfobaculum bizertense]UIJ36965.1 ribonuclease III [Desulfobaculum bizertense]SKA69805.1 RNAse III [Desulfobaculum bizertense DSM 18034]